MPVSRKPCSFACTILAILLCNVVVAGEQKRLGDDSPRAIVARWLELHTSGKRDEASELTTGAFEHRAQHALSKRDTGVRVAQSLGNQRAAAVVTTSLKGKDQQVLLFWLVKRDDAWRIHKSDSFARTVVDERLLGFMEAGDVYWHVQRDDVLGHWEAGPGSSPIGGGTMCGSDLQLLVDKSFQHLAYGPGGPDAEAIKGTWRLINDRIVLSHGPKVHVCQVKWLGKNELMLKPLGGKGNAEYDRRDVAWDAR